MISNFAKLLPLDEHLDFFESLKRYPPRSIRVKPALLNTPTAMDTIPVPWYSRGRVLESSNLRPSQFYEYLTGDYYIQDAGSMLALALLDVMPGEAICDLCAAPGGKASAILESLADGAPTLAEGGWLLANEPIRSRLPILEYALGRTGSFRFVTASEDPNQLAKRFNQTFDGVLVDAPCSGQALVANQKRGDNAYDLHQIEHSAARQRRILLEAVRLLKPGGRLVYSTCTFAMEENEEQIQFLMDKFADAWEPLLSQNLSPWASPICEGCYRVWPHRDPTAGAFAGGLRLIREIQVEEFQREAVEEIGGSMKASSARHKVFSERKKHKTKGSNSLLSSTQADEVLNSSFGEVNGLQLRINEERITVLQSDIQVDEALSWMRWPEIAVRVGNRWQPEYPLAMAHGKAFQAIRTIDLSDKEVKNYFAGTAIPKGLQNDTLSTVNESTSWCVALCRGKPIGWMKDAGNRFNNQLPKIAYQQMDGD